jgi:hypothetical protein
VWNKILLGKLILTHLVNKFTTVCITRGVKICCHHWTVLPDRFHGPIYLRYFEHNFLFASVFCKRCPHSSSNYNFAYVFTSPEHGTYFDHSICLYLLPPKYVIIYSKQFVIVWICSLCCLFLGKLNNILKHVDKKMYFLFLHKLLQPPHYAIYPSP